MDLGTFLLRMGLALILGAIMGLERQWHQRMAGTRTNALVSTAAAAFAMIGLMLSGEGSASRVIGQIVSGVGFLGAGVIFKEGGSIHGLNTAATVWCSASVGALSAIGYPQYACAVTVAVVLTNIVFRPLAYKLRPELKLQETNYHFELTCRVKDEMQIRALMLSALDNNHLSLTSLNSEDLDTGERVRVSAGIRAAQRNDRGLEQLVARVTREAGVGAVNWRVETPIVE
jgi:putative Mg2+ transporter-C (MgtC) family protein